MASTPKIDVVFNFYESMNPSPNYPTFIEGWKKMSAFVNNLDHYYCTQLHKNTNPCGKIDLRCYFFFGFFLDVVYTMTGGVHYFLVFFFSQRCWLMMYIFFWQRWFFFTMTDIDVHWNIFFWQKCCFSPWLVMYIFFCTL